MEQRLSVGSESSQLEASQRPRKLATDIDVRTSIVAPQALLSLDAPWILKLGCRFISVRLVREVARVARRMDTG